MSGIADAIAGGRGSRDFSQINGVLPGVVTQNADPDGLGRVKARLPTLNVETDWMRVATVAAGKDHGIFFLPDAGDEVLVAFQNGNVNLPYVVGLLFNGKSPPPVAKKKQGSVREIKTRGGNVILLDDTKDKEKIQIFDKNQNEILIDTSENVITVTSRKNLNLNAKGKLTIRADEIVLQSKRLSVKTDQDVTAKAGTNMTLQAKVLNAKGSQVNIG